MARMGIAELVGSAQALAAAGQGGLAAELYRDWAMLNPDETLLHAVHFNRGVLLADAGDLAGAVEAFTASIRCRPDFLPPYINLGAACERLGAKGQAFGHWAHVSTSLAGVSGETVAYKATALKQMAQMLEGGRQLAQAEDALRQVAELNPSQRDVVQHWISLRQRQCQWPVLNPVAGHDRAALLRRIAPLSMACLVDDPWLQLAVAAAHMREDVGMPDRFRSDADFAARRTESPGRRLRIGYLSSDLREHAVGSLMAELFSLHDRETVEVFAYYNGIPQEDATKARIRGSVEHWRDIAALQDAAAEAMILADGIDILVDVNGHTRGARTRLLARRPAPVIVNWLGYPGSMGSACHHYIIADPVIIPEGSEGFYSERVVRLPCYQPNDRRRPTAGIAPPRRAEHGLPEDATVFCSFNGTQKITPFDFARWMAILRSVPGSVLWLLKSCEEVEDRLRARAVDAGIAPERLVFAPILGAHDHLARYPLADLFLDTLPYGAHTTASDALWTGVPVLTVLGRGFAARVCASLVQAAGLPEFVCASPEDYVARAIALGRDRATLAPFRQRLLAGRGTSALFDTPRLVRSLEALFADMWRECAADRLPRPDLVNLDVYLELGAAMDHDAAETSFLPDYDARWRSALARRDAYAALPTDSRLHGGALNMAPLDAAAPVTLAALPLEALMPGLEGLPPSQAVAAYRGWLAANPASAQRFAAWFNLGALLGNSGDRVGAMIAYRQALTLKPDLHQAAVNLGLALEAEGRAEEALALWRDCLQPDVARTALLNQRGRLLESRKDYAEAERTLWASLLTDPWQPDVIQHWAHLRQKGCLWPVHGGGIPGLGETALTLQGGPLGALALTDDPSLQCSIGKAWITRKVPPAPARLAPPRGYAHDRIRIGYLSSDFCRHAMGFLIVELLEHHDRSRFDVFGYCSTPEDGSDLRRRIIAALDHHVPIGHLSEEEAARRIRGDEIDILVDLNGLTAGARLGALRWKPAPVQATYLGYVGPVPLPELDWMICDVVVVPPDQAPHYTPRPLPLPGCYQANDGRPQALPPVTRAAEGVPQDAFLLCCFNNFYKITPDVFDAWMAIMRAAPRAVLWLTEDNAMGVANLRRHARAAGIAAERLLFASRCDPQQYLARLGMADLFLDTFPYNAGTVASDALRMGLPIITLAGRAFASRMAASLLTAVGATDGIATTLDDYVAKAIAMATDPARHAAARAALTGDAWMRSLGDTAGFAARMEDAFERICLRP